MNNTPIATNPRIRALAKLREDRPEVTVTYHFHEFDIQVVCYASQRGDVHCGSSTSPRHMENDEVVFVSCLQIALMRLDRELTQCLLPEFTPPSGWISAGRGPFTEYAERLSTGVVLANNLEHVALDFCGPLFVKWGSKDHVFLAAICDEIPPPVDFSDCADFEVVGDNCKDLRNSLLVADFAFLAGVWLLIAALIYLAFFK